MWPFGGRFFPGTSLQDLNLDWIVQRVRDLSRGIIAPFINSVNLHWMVWDTDAETFVDSGVSAAGEGTGPQGEPGKSPIIGSNGHWYTWDAETSAYTDTGIEAQGPEGPTGPIGPIGPQGERGPGVNPNLLDNWYFVGGGSASGETFPINQRGQTSYLGPGYTIDCWRTQLSDITVTVPTNGSGVTITNNNTSSRRGLSQLCDSEIALYGKRLTGSILLSDGTLYSGTITVPNGKPSSTQYLNFVDFGGNTFRLDASASQPFNFTIMVGASQSITIAAVKVELGDTQTLAHQESGVWVLNEIPDFGEELLKCLRYLQVITNGTRFRPVNILSNRLDFNVPLVVPMAGTPTLQMGAAQFVISAFAVGAQAEEGFTYSIGSVGSSIAVIRATKANHGLTDARLAVSGEDIYLAV